MLIGSKYEEIWAPEVRDFVYISDKAYTREQILECEKLVLNTLKFHLTLPTCYNFLARFLKASSMHLDRNVSLLASYLVELAIVDAGMLKYSYSMIACASVYTAQVAAGKPDPFCKALSRHSAYSLEAVLPCASALVELMQKAPTHSLSAVYKKYSSSKFAEVSKVAPPESVIEDAKALVA
jgi:cyclin B